MDVLTKAMDDVIGQITKANVAIKTCHRYSAEHCCTLLNAKC